MAFEDDKQCIIDKIKIFGCSELAKVDASLQSYADIPNLFFDNIGTFECNPSYLRSLASCITEEDLETLGIYFNKTDAGPIVNPLIVLDSAIDEIEYDSLTPIVEVAIIGTSAVEKITVKANTLVSSLSVSAGAAVKLIQTESGACVNYLRVSGCKSYISMVGLILKGSCVNMINAFNGAAKPEFGCYEDLVCADNVTGLAASEVTYDSIKLSWTNAADTINTIVQYRLSGDNAWLTVSAERGELTGSFDGDNAYIFRGLKENTYYNFRVKNVCSNGEESSGTEITHKTT